MENLSFFSFQQLIFKRNEQYALLIKIKKIVFEKLSKDYSKENMGNLEFALEYHISAIIGIISYWFSSNKKLKEEDLLKKDTY